MFTKSARRLLVLLTFLTLYGVGEGARILALFPVYFPSHHTVLKPVMKALAMAGHEVVVYTPFPLENAPPTYKNILINTSASADELDEFAKISSDIPPYNCVDISFPLYKLMIDKFFKDEEIKKLLHSDEKFDVLFTEPFMSQHFVLVFSAKMKIPAIGINTMPPFFASSWTAGNSLSFATSPGLCFFSSDRMTFKQRFLNTYTILREIYKYYNHYLPAVESKTREYVPDAPPLADLTLNISLTFSNDHLTAGYARPRTPNMIPISGIHLVQAKPIPKDLQDFMDNAPKGVILFSLGTLVPDDLKPREYFDTLINVFKSLPQKVLWKSKLKRIEGLPNNVKLVNWMPQQDVLAHQNCILFITHGGMASLIETINAGVPVVAIPSFGDQFSNVAFYRAKEIGATIHFEDLSEMTLTEAIKEVLGNPKYRENMKRMSEIFKDRPMSPAETVVYWTEYVIRHGGAPHLRPSSTHLSWYQRFLLDIVATIIFVTCTAAVSLYFLLKKILTTLLRSTKKDLSLDKKTN